MAAPQQDWDKTWAAAAVACCATLAAGYSSRAEGGPVCVAVIVLFSLVVARLLLKGEQ